MVVQKVGMVTLVMTVGGASSLVQGSAGISQSRCSVSDLLVELPSPEKWNQLQKKKNMILGHQSQLNTKTVMVILWIKGSFRKFIP